MKLLNCTLVLLIIVNYTISANWLSGFFKYLDLNLDGIVSQEEIAMYIWKSELASDNKIDVPNDIILHKIMKKISNFKNGITYNDLKNMYTSSNGYLTSSDSNIPQQIHISLGIDPSHMIVMWNDKNNMTDPIVEYGINKKSMVNSSNGNTWSYSLPSYQSLSIHAVNITNLQPKTLYYYRVGTRNGTFSSYYSFTSSPKTNYISEDFETSIAVYGDMGVLVPFGFLVTKELIEQHNKKPFDLILHVGDIAYAGISSKSWGEYEPTWDNFMNQIQPLASAVPYQVTVGNHEAYYNYLAFNKRFRMYNSTFSSVKWKNNFWYSTDFGNIHMCSMSTEHPFDWNSEQYRWIENDLKQARENKNVKWLFVLGHRPYYSSDQSEYNSHSPGAPLLKYLEPLLLKYKVDLVLTGHMHCYERTYPVINGTVQCSESHHFQKNLAPIYIVQGTAGAFIDETFIEPKPSWSCVRKQNYGFGRLNIYKNKTTNLSNINYQFISNNLVVDEFWIH